MDWLVIKLLKSNTHFILVWRDVVFCYSHACLSLYFPWVIGSVFERNVQISPLLILITILFWVHLHLIPLSGNQFSISLKLNIHPWMRYGFVEMDQACERLRHEFTTLAGCIWKKHKIHISTTRKYFIKWQNTLHTWYWLVDWLIETFLYNTYTDLNLISTCHQPFWVSGVCGRIAFCQQCWPTWRQRCFREWAGVSSG